MTSREFQDRLTRRARRVGLVLPAELSGQLEAYYRLLASWNAKINLTGLKLVDAPSDALDRLLIEPVVAARYVPVGTARMLDIGTGGGFPGIPLAIALPDIQFHLVDSIGKKIQVVKTIAEDIAIDKAHKRMHLKVVK